jgi:hypothetical protein
MGKSDLLIKETLDEHLKKLNQVKNYVILAGNGLVGANEPAPMDHLQTLIDLEFDLENLKENLDFVEFKPE